MSFLYAGAIAIDLGSYYSVGVYMDKVTHLAVQNTSDLFRYITW